MATRDNQLIQRALYVAQLAAMEAGDYALREFTKYHVIKQKEITNDVFTKVDVESEKRIVRAIRRNFPDHTVFSEEGSPSRRFKKLTDYIWWVDPLDGSVSYVFNLPYWGISLGLIYDNEPIVGVLYFPQSRSLYYATKDGGAFLNYRKISVSNHQRVSQGIIGLDYGYAGYRTKGVKDVTVKLADKVKYLVTYACTIGAIALVAEGKIPGYVHHSAGRFDLAAGSLLVAEAGGKVTDTQGKTINWRDTRYVDYVCSNGKIHTELISILNK